MRTSWPGVDAILKTNKHVHVKDDKHVTTKRLKFYFHF